MQALHTKQKFIYKPPLHSDLKRTRIMAFSELGSPAPYVMKKVPVEVWKMIIVSACIIPRSLDTSSTSAFDHSEVEYSYTTFKNSLYATHDTKNNIKLVSRLFYDLVDDLCSQFLLLRDVQAGITLPFKWWELAAKYKYDNEFKEELGLRGNGWYVKRMELLIQANAETSEVDKVEAVGTFIACCPNVQMLSLSIPAVPGNSGIPYPVFNALFPSQTVNYVHLRRLDWNSDIISATNLLFTHLPSLINLESFHINLHRRYHSIPSAKYITLRALHTMEVVSLFNDPSGFLCVAETWNMDRITQFRLTTAIDTSEPLPFFTTHGSKFKTLDFTYLGSQRGPSILRLCIALEDMAIDIRWAYPHISKLFSKTVERIGIRGQFRNLSRFSEDVYHLFAWFDALLNPFVLASENIDQLPIFRTRLVADQDGLESQPPADALKRAQYLYPAPIIPYRFPALRIIRLLEFYPALFQDRKWLSDHITMWAFWEKRLEKLNIVLEDHEGKPIKLHISKINFWLKGDPPCKQYGYV